MKRPVIALTPQYDGEKNRTWMRSEYGNAVLLAGGVPVLLEQFGKKELYPDVLDRFDGILFTGGDDVNPTLYGEEIEPKCGDIHDCRDSFEIEIYRIATERNMPVFGICRGIQLINVAAGGSLIQHVDGQRGVNHDVVVENDGLFRDIVLDAEFVTNSWHHQCVKDVAPGFKVGAYTDTDEYGKLVEAIYNPDYAFNVAVQWHPENMYTYNNDIHAQRLFAAFIEACRNYHQR